MYSKDSEKNVTVAKVLKTMKQWISVYMYLFSAKDILTNIVCKPVANNIDVRRWLKISPIE